MPFDGPDIDIGKPSLRALSALLRDSSRWPHGFYWDYASADHCAIGLARDCWGCYRIHDLMPDRAASRMIFFHLRSMVTTRGDITPYMVAEAIDHHLAKGGEEICLPAPVAKSWFSKFFR